MAAYLGTVGLFEHVLVVPVYGHVFDKQFTPFEHRLRMCRLAFENLQFVEVSPIEATLRRPNYTLHTLQAIKRAHPDWQLRLAMGADVLAEAHQWHAFDEVIGLAPPFVFGRHGSASDGTTTKLMPAISSTQIRDRLQANPSSLSDPDIEAYMPLNVREYIEENQLYR